MPNQHTKAKDDKQRLEDELLATARKRFKAAQEAEKDMRTEYLTDLKFRAGDQWPDAIKSIRDQQKKPCLTVNRLQQFEKQVTNQMRQSRPGIEVSPGDHEGDVDTAEVIQGLIRHIEYDSNAPVAYERGGTSAVRGGIGFWRVLPEYEDEKGFNQVLRIKSIRDAMMVSIDPASQEPDGSDMKWGFVYENVPDNEFEELYPEATTTSANGFELLNATAPDWLNGHDVRVAEHYYFDYTDGFLYETQDGKVTTEKPEAFKRKRAVRIPQLMWVKLTGVEILEGPLEQPGRYVPIVPIYGDEIVVDGKVIHEGIIRNSRDSVRMSNYWASKEAEAIALAPKAPFILAEGQEEGHEAEWASANNDDRAYLLYKPTAIGEHLAPPPQRNVVEPAIQAISHARMMCIEDLKAITGIFDPSLGNRDAAQSGVAIRSLQSQGNTANFHFVDNQHRSILQTGRILVDLIPHYYDAEEVVQIVGEDGEAKTVTINGPSGVKDPKTGIEKIYDMTTGKYHVVLSAGASYQTKRQEEAAFLEKAMQAFPELMKLAGDLVFRTQDSPGAEAIANRLKKALPPELQDEDPNEPKGQIPPQVQQQMGQAKQMIEQLVQQLHETKDQLDAAQSGNDTKLQVAAMQEETKRLIALLTTGSKNAQVELQHSVAVLDAQATREHAMSMAALPPQQPGAPADTPQPAEGMIPSPEAPSGTPAGLAPQGSPDAGAPAGMEQTNA
jgi:hypothetical protein